MTGDAGAGPVLSVGGFEGPLEFLLEMARARRIDLRRLSVLDVVEALSQALETALADHPRQADLTRWGEWLGMAAHLALLRSRLLLPPEEPEAIAAVAQAAALRRQLLERAAMQRAAAWLDARPQLGRTVFARERPHPAPGAAAPSADITALFLACLVALRVPGQATSYAPKPPPLWRVADAAERITRLLELDPKGGELGHFLPPLASDGPEHELRCRAALASTLVAGLELCRTGAVTMHQEPGAAQARISAAGEACRRGHSRH